MLLYAIHFDFRAKTDRTSFFAPFVPGRDLSTGGNSWLNRPNLNERSSANPIQSVFASFATFCSNSSVKTLRL